MKISKQVIGTVVVLGGLAALSLPISNWLIDPEPAQLAAKYEGSHNAAFKKAAPILEAKCAHCHVLGTPKPFYANFPVASTLIEKDIEGGLARLDMAGKLSGDGEPFSEIELARLESVIHEHSMPPLKYSALHWKSVLSKDDQSAILDWIHSRRVAMRHDPTVPPENAGGPLYPIPLTVSLNADKVALGNKLFHDTRLSGDNTISCASCHDLRKGGTDHDKVSTGIRGQKGGINAPTVYNATYNFVQFWDGRAKDLNAQSRGPVQNPVEMGATFEQVIAKLKQDPKLVAAFAKYYPDGITEDTIADAIVTFEDSLITPNSRFDQYLRGHKTALTRDELAGYSLFKTHCASCHAGTNVGGLSYEKMGWRRDYFLTRGNVHKDDFGRFNVTELEKDRHYFKVPTLRNVEVTWPYFHDGSTSDLRQAVQVMADYQVEAKLSPQEIDQITAFLKTLTGEYQGKSLQNAEASK